MPSRKIRALTIGVIGLWGGGAIEGILSAARSQGIVLVPCRARGSHVNLVPQYKFGTSSNFSIRCTRFNFNCVRVLRTFFISVDVFEHNV